MIAGFWLIQVKSKEEAIAWMKRAPFGDGVVLEIRHVFETDDFAPSNPRASSARTKSACARNWRRMRGASREIRHPTEAGCTIRT